MTTTQNTFQCTRDGLTIRGAVYRRKHGVRQPIVILSHEFMANRRFVSRYAKMFAELGYAAFTYDFCGGCAVGSSDGRTEDMTVFTECRDLEAVMDYACSQEYTDEYRITLLGCSQGGLVSGLVAARHPDKIEMLILLYPALSIPDDARKGKMLMAQFDPNAIPETFRCGPMKLGREYATSVMDLDPFEILGSYKGNVLLLHGDRDDLVPLSYSHRAMAMYRQAQKEAEPDWKGPRSARLVVIPGAGHIFRKNAHMSHAMGSIQSFLLETSEISNYDHTINSDHILYMF